VSKKKTGYLTNSQTGRSFPVTAHMPDPKGTGWTMPEVVQEFVKDIEAAHGKGAPDLRDEWPDLHATYELAVRVLGEQGGAVG
jgi:hypothetical protein